MSMRQFRGCRVSKGDVGAGVGSILNLEVRRGPRPRVGGSRGLANYPHARFPSRELAASAVVLVLPCCRPRGLFCPFDIPLLRFSRWALLLAATARGNSLLSSGITSGTRGWSTFTTRCCGQANHPARLFAKPL